MTFFLACALGILSIANARADVFFLPKGVTSLELVTIGAAGNLADDNGYGSVPYVYRIGKHEVTAAQYVEFLQAVASKADPYSLRSNNTEEKAGCGVTRQGEDGAYRYSVTPGNANLPVNHVSFWDACRFCNWLHNGQGGGDTETGAYELRGFQGADGRRIRRSPGARFFLPSEDEWYKAAYYDPDKPGGAGYWDYPFRRDLPGSRDRNSDHGSNSYAESFLDPERLLTPVGHFPRSVSPFGTLDQAGNVMEWNEARIGALFRGLRGGAYATSDQGRNERPVNDELGVLGEMSYIGFRVAAAGTDASHTTSPSAVPKDSESDTSQNLIFARRPWRDSLSGKPFFPMGWYTWKFGDEEELRQMAAEGANVVLAVSATTDLDQGEEQFERHLASMLAYLDMAQRHGLRVIMQAAWYEAFREGDTAQIDRIRRFIERVSQHPALLAYQLYDEPEYKVENGFDESASPARKKFIDALTRNRLAIRKWDKNPHRPVQVVFNLVPLSSYASFLPAIDGFQIDRYPIWPNSPFMAHNGDWGPLMMAWSIAHGARTVQSTGHLNPVPVMQGVGQQTSEDPTYFWRNPTFEETRYMAYSSLTAGGWGFLHWIRDASNPEIRGNVARLHAEFRELLPALVDSYEQPPFSVEHDHHGLTRQFLTDLIPDLTTLTLRDQKNDYLVVSCNSRTLENLDLRLKLPVPPCEPQPKTVHVLNESWSRPMRYDAERQSWRIAPHTMSFGDINVWVIPREQP